MRYYHIVLTASVMLLFCILSVAPTLADAGTLVPYNVAPNPDGSVYVPASDTVTMANNIFVFAPDGTLVKTLDRQTRNLAFDDAGNLYALDEVYRQGRSTLYNITRLDKNGNATILWNNTNESDRDVIDMAVSPDGIVYFSTIRVDRNQSAQAGDPLHRWEIDAVDADGTLRVACVKNTTIISEGFGTIAADRNGTLYTAGASNRITVISPDGTIGTIGKLGSANGTFSLIYDLAIGRDGYLYVMESGNRRIQKLTTDCTFVAKWGGCGPDPLIGHCELAADENGRVYVADLDNRRVVWLTPEYTFGTDASENLKGSGVTWGTIYAGTNYTTLLLEQKFEELQNESETTPMPGFAAFAALIGIGLGATLYCLRK